MNPLSSRASALSGFCCLAALVAALVFLFSCESKERSKPGKTFPVRVVHRSFIESMDGISFSGQGRGEPAIKEMCTTLNWRHNGGYRKTWCHDRDFVMDLALDEVPAGAVFETGFGIDMKEHENGETVSAEYKIYLNGKAEAGRDILSFDEEESRIWYDETLDLHAFEGKGLTVRLETCMKKESGSRVLRGWSDPRVVVSSRAPWADTSPEKPNVLVVVVDTLRADTLGCYGYEKEVSPNLDAFSENALLFDNAFSTSSWTWPATASLLTGQHPVHHGVIDKEHSRLLQEKLTLAEICRSADMYTGAFVANPLLSKGKNFDQGFVVYEMVPSMNAGNLTDRFLDWLETAGEGRFFAYLHYLDPHYNYDPPPEFRKRFVSMPDHLGSEVEEHYKNAARRINLGYLDPELFHEEAREYLRQEYDGEIAYWDNQFGRIIARLKENRLLENTMVVVTSDHGEEFLEHGKLGHGWNLYDETIRVPLVLYGPGIDPGRVPDQVSLVSVTPTVARAAGLATPREADFDGVDLLSHDNGGFTFAHTEHACFPGAHERISAYSIRSAAWKFMIVPDVESKLLYNLDEDPAEQNELISRGLCLAEADRLERLLRYWMEEQKKVMPDSETVVDETTRSALKQLGYIQD